MSADKPNYAVRRALVLTPLVIALLWAGLWALRRSVAEPSYACSQASVGVEAGDTVWSIAHEYCSGDRYAVIDLLVRMYGTDIDTWQTIDLPVRSPRSPEG